VVHFCRTHDALIGIMTSGVIEGRTTFEWAREYEQERDAAQERREPLHAYPTQKSVCLSEVPLDLLDRLIDRHQGWFSMPCTIDMRRRTEPSLLDEGRRDRAGVMQ
jgi:hypothetical protein